MGPLEHAAQTVETLELEAENLKSGLLGASLPIVGALVGVAIVGYRLKKARAALAAEQDRLAPAPSILEDQGPAQYDDDQDLGEGAYLAGYSDDDAAGGFEAPKGYYDDADAQD